MVPRLRSAQAGQPDANLNDAQVQARPTRNRNNRSSPSRPGSQNQPSIAPLIQLAPTRKHTIKFLDFDEWLRGPSSVANRFILMRNKSNRTEASVTTMISKMGEIHTVERTLEARLENLDINARWSEFAVEVEVEWNYSDLDTDFKHWTIPKLYNSTLQQAIEDLKQKHMAQLDADHVSSNRGSVFEKSPSQLFESSVHSHTTAWGPSQPDLVVIGSHTTPTLAWEGKLCANGLSKAMMYLITLWEQCHTYLGASYSDRSFQRIYIRDDKVLIETTDAAAAAYGSTSIIELINQPDKYCPRPSHFLDAKGFLDVAGFKAFYELMKLAINLAFEKEMRWLEKPSTSYMNPTCPRLPDELATRECTMQSENIIAYARETSTFKATLARSKTIFNKAAELAKKKAKNAEILESPAGTVDTGSDSTESGNRDVKDRLEPAPKGNLQSQAGQQSRKDNGQNVKSGSSGNDNQDSEEKVMNFLENCDPTQYDMAVPEILPFDSEETALTMADLDNFALIRVLCIRGYKVSLVTCQEMSKVIQADLARFEPVVPIRPPLSEITNKVNQAEVAKLRTTPLLRSKLEYKNGSKHLKPGSTSREDFTLQGNEFVH